MSELGTFLETVYGPSNPFRTVRATVRQRCNRDLAENASGGGRIPMGRRKENPNPSEQTPAVKEASLSIWINLPDQFRIEERSEPQEATESSLIVVNREQWWRCNQQGHVETGESFERKGRRRGKPPMTDMERHFSQELLREFFVNLSLQSVGSVQTAGRPCIRVRAVPRPDAQIWPHWLPFGADEYELHADPERGSLLYIAGLFQGDVFDSSEVAQVTFDEPMDDGLFVYTPQPGEQMHSSVPCIERLTLESALAQVSHTVLIPSRLPSSHQTGYELMYHPPRGCSSRSQLSLMYRGDQRLWIHESESPDPELAKLEWEEIERDGKRMSLSDPGPGVGMRVIALEQHATHVTIWSDLDRDTVIDIAASLAPARAVRGG